MAGLGDAALIPSASAPEVRYGKLSPGPGLSSREVASHQRARLHAAMVEIAGEYGYEAVTVRELARLAGVSTRAFYEGFRDKEECFLKTYELVVQRAAAEIYSAQNGERRWPKRLRRALAALGRHAEAADVARGAEHEAIRSEYSALADRARGGQL